MQVIEWKVNTDYLIIACLLSRVLQEMAPTAHFSQRTIIVLRAKTERNVCLACSEGADLGILNSIMSNTP